MCSCMQVAEEEERVKNMKAEAEEHAQRMRAEREAEVENAKRMAARIGEPPSQHLLILDVPEHATACPSVGSSLLAPVLS